MREDFRVPAVDSLDIWKIAKAQRRRLVRQNADRVDVLGCLEATEEIWTSSGNKPFRLAIVADEDMPANSCWAFYSGAEVVLKAPRHVRYRALVGDGDARFMLARGLGTATLHLEALLERRGQPRPLFERVAGLFVPMASRPVRDRFSRRRLGMATPVPRGDFHPRWHRRHSGQDLSIACGLGCVAN